MTTPTSLTRVFVLLGVWLSAVAALQAMALIGSLYLYGQLNRELEDFYTSIRAAEEIELNLLRMVREQELYDQDKNPDRPEQIAHWDEELEEWIGIAAHYLGTEEEGAVYDSLTEQIDWLRRHFFGVPIDQRLEREGRLPAAIVTAELLIRLNELQGDEAVERSVLWRRTALFIGSAGFLVALVGVFVNIRFARRSIYEPVRALREAMRLRAVDSETKVPEQGPLELREIGRDVNELVDRLSRQREEQLTFLSAVAHDLRNPMTSLRATAQLLGRPLDPEKQKERAETILNQVDRMHRLLDDLLDVSRIEAGHFEIVPERKDLRDVAREVCELFADASKKHELRLSVSDEPAMVDVDPVRMGQVFNNLVSNAVKYTPQGGPIDLRVYVRDEEAYFEVQDRGLGIAEDELDTIFQPFGRSAGHGGRIHGVGLGLSVARRLTRAQGGDIEVASEVGKGSTFRVRLPLAK